MGGQRCAGRGEELVYPGTFRVQCLLVSAQLSGCALDLGWRAGGQSAGHVALNPLGEGERPGDKVVHRHIEVERLPNGLVRLKNLSNLIALTLRQPGRPKAQKIVPNPYPISREIM